MAAIHLLVGFMGFGKTTLAKKLEKELPAVRFTPDEFMQKLYSRNLPDEEFRVAQKKIDNLIWDLAAHMLNAGADVILDYGFWSKEIRKEAFDKSKVLTDKIIFHQINCDIEVAKKRVLLRSAQDLNELFIDENCFNMFLQQYEPISPNENYHVINY